jgi:signal peptidase I
VQAFFIPSGRWSRHCTAAPAARGPRAGQQGADWFGEPEPGDIVVFKGPDTWTPEVTVTEPGNR